MGQDRPEMYPRWPPTGPSGSKVSPNWPQDGPSWPGDPVLEELQNRGPTIEDVSGETSNYDQKVVTICNLFTKLEVSREASSPCKNTAVVTDGLIALNFSKIGMLMGGSEALGDMISFEQLPSHRKNSSDTASSCTHTFILFFHPLEKSASPKARALHRGPCRETFGMTFFGAASIWHPGRSLAVTSFHNVRVYLKACQPPRSSHRVHTGPRWRRNFKRGNVQTCRGKRGRRGRAGGRRGANARTGGSCRVVKD